MPPLPQAPPPAWTANQHVTLYHGTASVYRDAILAGVSPAAGGRSRDFGCGFYTTTFEYQAVMWARRLARILREDPPRHLQDDPRCATAEPVVLSFRVPLAKLAGLRSLSFVRPQPDSELYWSFVCHCRLFPDGKLRKNQNPAKYTHLFDHPDGQKMYDVVSGPVAAEYPKKRGEEFRRSVHPEFDQFSFHTADAAAIFNDLIQTGQRGRDYDHTTFPMPSE